MENHADDMTTSQRITWVPDESGNFVPYDPSNPQHGPHDDVWDRYDSSNPQHGPDHDVWDRYARDPFEDLR